MAPGKVAADFNAIINADRQRRKNEALAQEIFSKGRRASAPGAGMITRKPGTGPSLASRVGVVKRTVSTSMKPSQRPVRSTTNAGSGNVDAEWTHDLHALNNPAASRVSQLSHHAPKPSRAARDNRLYSALNGSASSQVLRDQVNIIGSGKLTKGMSIRGIAGPFTVVAKNFAYGTTVADIETAITPIGGETLSCRLIAERPSVIAEIVFESKESADKVVDTFNNQSADGKVLHVYHKIGPPATTPKPFISAPPSGPVQRAVTPLGPRADTLTDRSDDTRPGYGDRYNQRDRSQNHGGDYDRDEVMDGSYGFDDRMDADGDDDRQDRGRGRGGLYSDSIVGRRGDRNRGHYR